MEKGLQRILNDVNLAIVKATRRNDNKSLKDLLKILKGIIILDPELEEKSSGVDAALLISVRNGKYKIVKKLLKNGAQKFDVALKLAILNNHYEVSQLLVQAMMEDNQSLYDFFALAIEKCPDPMIADYISLAMNETGEMPYADEIQEFCDKGCPFDDVEYPSEGEVRKAMEQIMNQQAKRMKQFAERVLSKEEKADEEDLEKKDKFPDLGSLSWYEIEELAEKIAKTQEQKREEFIMSCLPDEKDSGDSKN